MNDSGLGWTRHQKNRCCKGFFLSPSRCLITHSMFSLFSPRSHSASLHPSLSLSSLFVCFSLCVWLSVSFSLHLCACPLPGCVWSAYAHHASHFGYWCLGVCLSACLSLCACLNSQLLSSNLHTSTFWCHILYIRFLNKKRRYQKCLPTLAAVSSHHLTFDTMPVQRLHLLAELSPVWQLNFCWPFSG